jgi:hypothetical protein
MRVYEIGIAADLPSRDVKDYLQMLGQPVKTVSANIKDPIFAQAIIARLIATRDDFARSYLQPPF